jgi:CHAT domain-containing protein/tetratricopeptide (TPR) repeat protein
MRLALAVLLIALPSATARAADPGAAFARALAAAAWGSPDWSDAREAVELYDCVSVRAVRTFRAPDGGAIVAVDAIGMRTNGVERALPERWHLTLRDGRIERVLTEGAWLASRGDPLETAGPRTLVDAARSVLQRDDCRRSAETCASTLAQIAAVVRRRGDAIAAAYVLAALGQAEQKIDRVEEARRLANGDPDALAWADLSEARITTDRDRRDELYARGAGAVDELDDPRLALQALKERAELAFDRYRINDAAKLYSELERTSRRTGWARGAMYGLHGQARVNAAVRDYEGARGFAARAVAIARELGDADGESRALSLAGQTLTFTGDAVAAIPLLLEALDVAPAESTALLSSIHTNLAKCYTRLADWPRVELHVARALEAAEASGAAEQSLLAYEFAATHTRDCRQAIALGRRALRMHNGRELWMVWTIKARLGQGLLACGERAEGVRELYEAIDLVEARRALTPTSEFQRANYFAGHVWVYRALVAGLVELGHGEEAFAVAEQMRTRWLADTFAAAPFALTRDEEARQRALNERIVELNRSRLREPDEDARIAAELQAVRGELQRFATELALRHPQLPGSGPYDAAATRGGLRADAAAVEFVVTEKTIVAFVVRSTGVSAVSLPGASAEIVELARRFAKKVATRDPVYAADAEALYVRLFAPLRSALAGVNNLVVIADDALWLIPFEALRPSPDSMLADHYAIEYRLSLTSRRAPQDMPPADASILLLAGPSSASHPPLPDATRETRQIAELYGSSRADVYEEAEARESSLKKDASRYGIIHFATHGFGDGPEPMFSSLLLAASAVDRDDGLLEAREIAQLSLSARVVVLAACDTAGEVVPGEGMIGLSWAFLAAGAEKVVVTRWKAESRATARLMVEFHRRLARGDSGVGAALRAARDKLRAQPRYRHPFYWAPFVVIGS